MAEREEGSDKEGGEGGKGVSQYPVKITEEINVLGIKMPHNPLNNSKATQGRQKPS